MRTITVYSTKELLDTIEKKKEPSFVKEELTIRVLPKSPNKKIIHEGILDLSELFNTNIESRQGFFIVNGIKIVKSKNIKITGISIESSKSATILNAYKKQDEAVAYIKDSSEIFIQNSVFHGGLECPIGEDVAGGLAVSITSASMVNISSNTYRNWRDAISVRENSKNVTIYNNNIFSIGRDAIGIHNCEHIKIVGNKIYDFCPNYLGYEAKELPKVINSNNVAVAYLPADGALEELSQCNPNINPNNLGVSSTPADHADCIQLSNCNYVGIYGNEVGAREGQNESNSTWTQSIFVQHNGVNYPSDNWIHVISNIIRNRHKHGIYIRGYLFNHVIANSSNTLVYAASNNYCYRGDDVSIPIIEVIPS